MKAFRVVLLISTLTIAVSAFAQMGHGPGGGHGGMGHPMMSVDDRVNELNKQLSLSDGQKEQVRGILQDQQDQIKQLMQDSSISHQDKMSKMRSIHQASNGKIRDLLNDEQKKKFDDYLQKQQQRMQQHHGGPSGMS
jgi:Spy/CpxP family protein refolding chaperone